MSCRSLDYKGRSRNDSAVVSSEAFPRSLRVGEPLGNPVGFAAGDKNVTRYVGNSPTNATDPTGLIVFDKSKHPVTRKNIDERKGKELPNLGDEYEVILPVDRRFDCYSHAMRVYNKIGNAEELEKRLKEQGYELSPTLETDIPGHKVVIYGKKAPDGTITITHASVEYNDGSYQSKLGGGPLIRHKNAQQMCGPIYGEVTRIYIWKKKGG